MAGQDLTSESASLQDDHYPLFTGEKEKEKKKPLNPSSIDVKFRVGCHNNVTSSERRYAAAILSSWQKMTYDAQGPE